VSKVWILLACGLLTGCDLFKGPPPPPLKGKRETVNFFQESEPSKTLKAQSKVLPKEALQSTGFQDSFLWQQFYKTPSHHIAGFKGSGSKHQVKIVSVSQLAVEDGDVASPFIVTTKGLFFLSGLSVHKMAADPTVMPTPWIVGSIFSDSKNLKPSTAQVSKADKTKSVFAGKDVLEQEKDIILNPSGFALSLNSEKFEIRGNVWAGGLCSDGQDTLFATTGLAEVIAISISGNKILWRAELEHPARSAPVYDQGKVYCCTLKNQVLAFDSKTGAQLWKHQSMMEETTLFGGNVPALEQNLLISSASPNQITALSTKDGEQVWSYTPPLDQMSDKIVYATASPVIIEDKVYVGTCFRTLCLSLASGALVWSSPISTPLTPVSAGNYLLAIDESHVLVALDRHTGTIAWSTALPIDSASTSKWVGLMIIDGLIYVFRNDGWVGVFNPSQPKSLVRQVKLNHSLSACPIFVNGQLLLRADDGYLITWKI